MNILIWLDYTTETKINNMDPKNIILVDEKNRLRYEKTNDFWKLDNIIKSTAIDLNNLEYLYTFSRRFDAVL